MYSVPNDEKFDELSEIVRNFLMSLIDQDAVVGFENIRYYVFRTNPIDILKTLVSSHYVRRITVNNQIDCSCNGAGDFICNFSIYPVGGIRESDTPSEAIYGKWQLFIDGTETENNVTLEEGIQKLLAPR